MKTLEEEITYVVKTVCRLNRQHKIKSTYWRTRDIPNQQGVPSIVQGGVARPYYGCSAYHNAPVSTHEHWPIRPGVFQYLPPTFHICLTNKLTDTMSILLNGYPHPILYIFKFDMRKRIQELEDSFHEQLILQQL